MRKHIKRKFLNEQDLTSEIVDLLGVKATEFTHEELAKANVAPEKTLFLTTEDGRFLTGFQFKFQGNLKFIPEPDPILVYFHAAYRNFVVIKTMQKDLFSWISQEKLTETRINELYEYFGAASSFIILSFTAMEATINRCIPKDYVFKRKTDKNTQLYSKRQIERHLSFNEKFKYALPEATQKDFGKRYQSKQGHLTSLKEFRDMIVHTKEVEGNPTYSDLYKKALVFKYSEAIVAVKDFCNFYLGQNFIEECPCTNDW